MATRHAPEDLLSFPGLFEFKVFGETGDDRFRERVQQAVSQVVLIGDGAMKSRLSSGGRYQCLSVRVPLENATQLERIYGMLRSVQGLRYLL